MILTKYQNRIQEMPYTPKKLSNAVLECYQVTQSFRPHWVLGFTHPSTEIITRLKKKRKETLSGD
jgi:hypothetical protein